MTEIDTEQVRGFWRKVFAVNHVERYAYKRILALCDALDACRQDRDEWKREAQHWSSRPQEEAARARAAEAEVARLREDLREYGHHNGSCPYSGMPWAAQRPEGDTRLCTCGLDAALAPAPKDQPNNKEKINP